MESPITAQKAPFKVDVEASKNYLWCACGRNQKQPFCDGSHKGTGLTPRPFKAEESKAVWLSGCKRTKNQPMCDGTHKSL